MVSPEIVHLPNGQTLTVTRIFGGLYFKSNELSLHHNHCPFPPGWTVVLNSEYDLDPSKPPEDDFGFVPREGSRSIHPYHKATLHNDHLFISSISQPPSSEFKPASSQARHIAMMLWASLYWYFQQAEPAPQVTNEHSASTPTTGKPKGEWRIWINREGIFKSKHILPKLERMGLIVTEDSAVGADQDERAGEGWLEMFVSRRCFWQLDARIYLFVLSPAPGSPMGGNTPVHSRPGSPTRQGEDGRGEVTMSIGATVTGAAVGSQSPGPFTSTSHLPTYYPPPPSQFVYSNGVRHPIRPKPGKQGETVYTRYVPSVAQFLSFRIVSLGAKPLAHQPRGSLGLAMSANANNRLSVSDSVVPTLHKINPEGESDVELLNRWMNDPRVSN
jgi:N5-hydroxyornithine acetyltransferase